MNEQKNVFQISQLENAKKIYFVIDMKSFFASVECAERGLDPFKTNLVVADPSRGEGGICLAVSPKMKNLGVKNRCRFYEIPKEIDFIVAKPQMKKYIDYAARIYEIYLKYIDKNDIHVYSIDESFIDATSYIKLYKISARDFAFKLMKEINDTLHIPSSTGIGTNMYLAKIALDITAKKSKDRIGWLTEEKFIETLWHHRPITDFWQISVGTKTRLEKLGIYDMAGIANSSENSLYDAFGINAELLIDHAWGRESCEISDIKKYKRKSKSIGSSQILPKNYDFESAKIVLSEMIQSGCYTLTEEHYVTNLLHIYVGYGETPKSSAKGSIRLAGTTNVFSIIEKSAIDLFNKIVDKNKMIRRIGFEFCELENEDFEQYDFFADITKIEKQKRLAKSVISVHKKFGKNSLLKGIDLEQSATQIERNKMIGGHSSGEE